MSLRQMIRPSFGDIADDARYSLPPNSIIPGFRTFSRDAVRWFSIGCSLLIRAESSGSRIVRTVIVYGASRCGPAQLPDASHSEERPVRLLSRNGTDWTKRYPWIVDAALKNRQKHFVVDGRPPRPLREDFLWRGPRPQRLPEGSLVNEFIGQSTFAGRCEPPPKD
jgi:hypothetical protein